MQQKRNVNYKNTIVKGLTLAVVVAAVLVIGSLAHAADPSTSGGTGKPNIVLILADNFGYGELGSYGGGVTRGAPTPRLDELARHSSLPRRARA